MHTDLTFGEITSTVVFPNKYIPIGQLRMIIGSCSFGWGCEDVLMFGDHDILDLARVDTTRPDIFTMSAAYHF
jgi:hypothetical protein